MVKAGGNGKGTTSNRKAPKKTKAYCHPITLFFTNGISCKLANYLMRKEKVIYYFFNTIAMQLIKFRFDAL